MADAEEDDSAEWLRELVGFSLPAASVQVDDSTEWLNELLASKTSILNVTIV